jgi:AcrR family transcriptional regulator
LLRLAPNHDNLGLGIQIEVNKCHAFNIDNEINDVNIVNVVKSCATGKDKQMGIEERRQRERDEVREKIVDAARQIFIECGYEGVTMRKIAERIEYSPTTIYLYFADKETLFREMCNTDFRNLAAKFQSAALIANPVERLRVVARAYVQFGIEHPNHYRLMFMTPPPVIHKEEDFVHKGNPNEDAYAFLLSIVTSAIEAGVFRPEYRDAHLVAQTLWAAVHGVISIQIAQGCESWVGWAPFERRTETMVDGILRGLANPESLSKE